MAEIQFSQFLINLLASQAYVFIVMHLEKPDTSGKWQTEYLKPKFHFDDYESSPSVQGKVKYVDTLSLITFFILIV